MCKDERQFVRWLQQKQAPSRSTTVLGIGDDMACIAPEAGTIWVTSDILLDGVHFDASSQSLADIGRKAIAASLSDCAGMCVEPLGATVSVALPAGWVSTQIQQLHEGMNQVASEFGCDIVGGDTTRWSHPLVIDVAMLARPWQGIEPRRRDMAKAGDVVCVSGFLGGSLAGHHLRFTPRVKESCEIAGRLGASLHAMMDVSDGLSLDVARLCEASGVGVELDESGVLAVASEAAQEASAADERTVLDHVLNDGEDFELLLTVGPDAESEIREAGLYPVGRIVEEKGLQLKTVGGAVVEIEGKGYDHFHG